MREQTPPSTAHGTGSYAWPSMLNTCSAELTAADIATPPLPLLPPPHADSTRPAMRQCARYSSTCPRMGIPFMSVPLSTHVAVHLQIESRGARPVSRSYRRLSGRLDGLLVTRRTPRPSRRDGAQPSCHGQDAARVLGRVGPEFVFGRACKREAAVCVTTLTPRGAASCYAGMRMWRHAPGIGGHQAPPHRSKCVEVLHTVALGARLAICRPNAGELAGRDHACACNEQGNA
jgi:hypothetical protein